MSFIHQQTGHAIKARGIKVVSFDKDVSSSGFMHAIDHAQRQLARKCRYGSRRVKVAVRQARRRAPIEAVAAVRAARQFSG
jgi:hypothetical protein